MSGAVTARSSNLFGDIVVPIDDKSPLNKIGGITLVDSATGKIISLRTGENTFVAFSAKCTHKRTLIEYDESTKQFVCPNHGSRFDGTSGKVIEGPADIPLPSYPVKGTAKSVTVSVGT